MAIKTKIFSSLALTFAVGAFSVFATAQTTETPAGEANKAEKHEGKRAGKRGKFGKRGGMRHGGHRMGGGMGMFRGIELTDAQKEQIKAIRQANKPSEETMALMKSIRETRKSGGTITEEQKAQMQQLRESRRAKMQDVHQQILGVLTAEQKAQLETLKAERQQRREQFRQKRQEMREKRKAETATPKQIS